MEAQHTQGRTIEHGRGEYVVRGGEDENRAVLARLHYAHGVEVAREQALKLAQELATAPELFEALAAWLDCTDPTTANVIGGRVADYRAAHALARSALSRARGGVR